MNRLSVDAGARVGSKVNGRKASWEVTGQLAGPKFFDETGCGNRGAGVQDTLDIGGCVRRAAVGVGT